LTARMKHRGTARKRLLVVQGDGALPQPGTALKAGSRDIGEITSAYGSRGFALVRLDRLEEAAGDAIEADGVRVGVIKPSWLFA
jgi:folate-binding Fe-S cluster repair protein YgfZ